MRELYSPSLHTHFLQNVIILQRCFHYYVCQPLRTWVFDGEKTAILQKNYKTHVLEGIKNESLRISRFALVNDLLFSPTNLSINLACQPVITLRRQKGFLRLLSPFVRFLNKTLFIFLLNNKEGLLNGKLFQGRIKRKKKYSRNNKRLPREFRIGFKYYQRLKKKKKYTLKTLLQSQKFFRRAFGKKIKKKGIKFRHNIFNIITKRWPHRDLYFKNKTILFKKRTPFILQKILGNTKAIVSTALLLIPKSLPKITISFFENILIKKCGKNPRKIKKTHYPLSLLVYKTFLEGFNFRILEYNKEPYVLSSTFLQYEALTPQRLRSVYKPSYLTNFAFMNGIFSEVEYLSKRYISKTTKQTKIIKI